MTDDRIEFVTSVNRIYLERYGRRLVDTLIHNTVPEITLTLYCDASGEGLRLEDYTLPDGCETRVTRRDLYQNTTLTDYLARAAPLVEARIGHVPADPDARQACSTYDYRWDAITFGKKAFSLNHALATSAGRYCFWIDSDVVARKFLPTQVLLDLFRGDADVVYFGRRGYHSETGFIGFDLHSDRTRRFARLLREMWEEGRVFSLEEGWTDSDAFDAALRSSLETFGLRARNLATRRKGHVIAASPLGQYLDHLKGPRKAIGYSPERTLWFLVQNPVMVCLRALGPRRRWRRLKAAWSCRRTHGGP